MAKNTFNKTINTTTPTSKQPRNSSGGISGWLARVLDMEDLVLGMPKYYLNYGLWLFFLTITYIYFSHKYENYLRTIEKLKVEIDDKRSEYTSRKASYMKETKKSELFKKVAPYGLEENTIAPRKIVVEK